MAEELRTVARGDALYPRGLAAWVDEPPPCLHVRGDLSLLENRFTALLCSSRCPGRLVSKTYDLAQRLRAEGRAVIGGFQAPMEQESLRVLLQSRNPVAVFCARGIDRMRLRPEWQRALDEGRLLMLSALRGDVRRVTRRQALLRNVYVAAMSEEILIAHAADGSAVSDVASHVLRWNKPLYTLEDEANFLLQFLGASNFSL